MTLDEVMQQMGGYPDTYFMTRILCVTGFAVCKATQATILVKCLYKLTWLLNTCTLFRVILSPLLTMVQVACLSAFIILL